MAAKTNPEIVAFTGGEVDKYTLARTDLAIHSSTAETLENLFLIEQGAMELAPGTIHIGETPSSGVSLVRPWAFSLEAAFCLEISANLLRFITGTGYVLLTGAAATIGNFADQSAAPPAGGGAPPAGGGGEGNNPPSEGEWVWIEYGEGGSGYWYFTGPGEIP